MNIKKDNLPTVLEAKNLTKTFYKKKFFVTKSSFTAVNNISFKLKKGEILGFLGVNGSGKTTTIQMLLGTLIPTSGEINYFGHLLSKQNSPEILRLVTHASAYSKLINKLTVYENLLVYGRMFGMSYQSLKTDIKLILEEFTLWDKRDALGHSLSAGQTTRAILARAFLPKPQIVLLDEPTASLDPNIAHQVRDFILHQQKEYKTSILFTSHNMEEVAQLCNRVLLLDAGNIVAQGTPQELAAQITKTHVWLIVENIHDRTWIENYSREHKWSYELSGNTVSIGLEESDITKLLRALGQNNIEYSGISIDKPHLEDYFLQVVRRKK